MTAGDGPAVPSTSAGNRGSPAGSRSVDTDTRPLLRNGVPDRFVLVVTGGAASLQTDERQPLLTISTGGVRAGNVDRPVVEGALSSRRPRAPAAGAGDRLLGV